MEVMKVSSKTPVVKLAGAIAGYVRECDGVKLQAIGAGAVNQAAKAIAVSRGFLALNGVDLICIPAFENMKINGEERTVINFIVEPRR